MAQYSSTKFDSPASEVVYYLSLDDSSETTGDVESSIGYVSLIHVNGKCLAEAKRPHTSDWVLAELRDTYGVTPAMVEGWWLVTIESQGFVGTTRFPTEWHARNAFDALQGEFAYWCMREGN